MTCGELRIGATRLGLVSRTCVRSNVCSVWSFDVCSMFARCIVRCSSDARLMLVRFGRRSRHDSRSVRSCGARGASRTRNPAERLCGALTASEGEAPLEQMFGGGVGWSTRTERPMSQGRQRRPECTPRTLGTDAPHAQCPIRRCRRCRDPHGCAWRSVHMLCPASAGTSVEA
jgi:hypothetical protein